MQELSTQQINEAIDDSVAKQIPLGLSIQGDAWLRMHSRFLAIADEHILVEMPSADDGTPHEFVPAEKVALSFKLKHHKYLGQARVAGQRQLKLPDGTCIPTLSLCWPMHMQRLQRRSFARVAVPPGKVVRVSFWTGGCDAEPKGPSDHRSVWSGQVADLSAGGFQATVTREVPELVTGQPIGVRIVFGPGEASVYADAQFRHKQPDQTGVSLGFQFVGLAHTEQGRENLRLISRKMSEFSRSTRSSAGRPRRRDRHANPRRSRQTV